MKRSREANALSLDGGSTHPHGTRKMRTPGNGALTSTVSPVARVSTSVPTPRFDRPRSSPRRKTFIPPASPSPGSSIGQVW